MGSLTGSLVILFGGFPSLGWIPQPESRTQDKHHKESCACVADVLAPRFYLEGMRAKEIPNRCPERNGSGALLFAGSNSVDVSAGILVVGIELE